VLKGLILEDAVLWTGRTLQSGVPVNEVDVFTIVMGKTVEHYTRALANGGYGIGIALPDALSEMESFTKQVGGNIEIGQTEIERIYTEKVEQLSLFVLESKRKYGP